MRTITRTLAAALVLTVAGTATAQDQNPNAANRRSAWASGWFFHKADTDGDGQISQAEWQAAAATRWQAHKAWVAKHDTDGDGKLNDAERTAAIEQMKARWKEMIAKYDTDGDGKLSETERKAAREAFENRQAE